MTSISVCLIARNESENLPRALHSVASIADEILVTDTGSQDDTVDVARAAGAVVHHFAWCDDFAAARNATIEKARGDWIFWLDADEELLAESEEALRHAVRDSGLLAAHVVRQDLTRERPLTYTQMLQLRLFRNREDLRFRGRCHPQFYPTEEDRARDLGMRVEVRPVTIRHYGYLGALKRQKLERGVSLIRQELRDRPGQLYYLIEWYRALVLLQNPEAEEILQRAVDAFRPHAGDDKPPTPVAALLLETLLQVPDRLPDWLDADRVRELAETWFPSAPPLQWLLAMRDFQADNFQGAEERLRRLVTMGIHHTYDHSVSFDPAIVGGEAQLNLAVCLVRQAKLKEAREILKYLIAHDRQLKPSAQANLRAIHQLPGQRGRSPTKKRKKRR